MKQFWPFVVIGALLTLAGFVLGEFVVPVTAKKVRATPLKYRTG